MFAVWVVNVETISHYNKAETTSPLITRLQSELRRTECVSNEMFLNSPVRRREMY